MEIDDLTREAKEKVASKILAGLEQWSKDADEDALDSVLYYLIHFLDVEDEEDTFGTEGWEHRFNI